MLTNTDYKQTNKHTFKTVLKKATINIIARHEYY